MARLPLILASLLVAANAGAWDTSAHKTIGVIAYRHLTPQAKAWADGLLRTLPAGYQDFLNAAPYPDYLKHGAPKDRPAIRRSRKFDGWHYIDYPVAKGQTATVPRDTSVERNGNNALYALAASVRNVRSGLPETRGLYLAMILHVVGDLHQPLHCAERDGDKGGNGFRLKGTSNNLHSLWDAGLTTAYRLKAKKTKGTDARIAEVASDLERRFPAASMAREIRVTDPHDWAMESYALAVGTCYRGVQPGSRPSDPYKDRVNELSARRVALAGYRLADFLNRVVAGRVRA
jgi:hypothetical protein